MIINSGRITPIAQRPTPDLAVPYAAPKAIRKKSVKNLVDPLSVLPLNTIAAAQPMAAKNGLFRVKGRYFRAYYA